MKKIIFVFLLLIAIAGIYEIIKIPQFSNFFNLNQQQPTQKNMSSLKISPTLEPTMPEVQSVSVTNNGFVPQELTIKKGEMITWTNNANGPVNISSDPYPLNNAYPPLNLGNFNAGESLSLIFDKPGTYKYHNHIIPPQKGTIIVQ